MPEPRKPGAREALRAFFRPSKGQLIAALVLFLTALLITWTLRSQADQPEFATARQEDLVQLLDNVTGQSRRLEEDLRELESTRDELLSGADQAEAARADAERRLEQLRIIAGTVPATGPGVRIEVEDPEEALTAEILLNAVEELRDAGAEVIEFGDEVRIVMDTAVTTDDEGRIVVGEVPFTAPYVIDVIGDPATLEAGARFRGGLVSEVEGSRVGGSVDITQLETVEVESTVDPDTYEFARPR